MLYSQTFKNRATHSEKLIKQELILNTIFCCLGVNFAPCMFGSFVLRY